MRTGMRWTYDRQVIIKKFTSDSLAIIRDADTINSEVTVWVDKDTVLNKKTVKVFKSKEEGMAFACVQFMLYDKDGLKTCASQNAGRKVWEQHGLCLKFASIGQLVNDTIHYNPSPILDLKLPLMPDSSWVYKYPTKSDTLQIEKVVTGTETLTLTGMKINCYKVDWIFSNDSLYNSYKTTEWLSEKGLMKRTTTYDRVAFLNENSEPMYEGQYIETLILKSFRYK
jgi:hypothetical protein